MIRYFLTKVFLKHKRMFFEEAQRISGFLALLMKQRNTENKWTEEEKKILKKHLKHLSLYIPALAIFILPGGGLLLALFAEIMDRRKTRRLQRIQEISIQARTGEESKSMVWKMDIP